MKVRKVSRPILHVDTYLIAHIAQAVDHNAEVLEDALNRISKLEKTKLSALLPVTPTQRWIPVSERLAKPFEHVNCTCHSLIDDREDWVVETCYIPQPHDSHYSDWGNIPMLNSCECEVIAWMYRDIPEPYKAERKGEE